VIQAAAISPGVAQVFVNMFNDIKSSLGWLTRMPDADAVLAPHAHELAGARLLTLDEAMARFMPPPADKAQAA
jgi:hypothetical protein